MISREQLIRFVEASWPPAAAGTACSDLNWEDLAGDGSEREFLRVISGNRSAVVVYGPDPEENRAYSAIGRHLWKTGRLGPEFLAEDLKTGLFLIEDLGRNHLQDFRGSVDLEGLYNKTLEVMAIFHHRGLGGFHPEWCYQTKFYDRDLILEKETGYFLRAFIQDYLGCREIPQGITDEFENLAAAALESEDRVLMHRDFQSRNVMIVDRRPRLIDFQGARIGKPGYDLAGLLYDPYMDLTEETRQRLFARYLDLSASCGSLDTAAFIKTYPCLAVCRLLQALGAYGFLVKVRHKQWFRSYIPIALKRLCRLLADRRFEFMPRLRGLAAMAEQKVNESS